MMRMPNPPAYARERPPTRGKLITVLATFAFFALLLAVGTLSTTRLLSTYPIVESNDEPFYAHQGLWTICQHHSCMYIDKPDARLKRARGFAVVAGIGCLLNFVTLAVAAAMSQHNLTKLLIVITSTVACGFGAAILLSLDEIRKNNDGYGFDLGWLMPLVSTALEGIVWIVGWAILFRVDEQTEVAGIQEHKQSLLPEEAQPRFHYDVATPYQHLAATQSGPQPVANPHSSHSFDRPWRASSSLPIAMAPANRGQPQSVSGRANPPPGDRATSKFAFGVQ
eukprot:gb/GECG01016138.1/.p1 GENE.gb/GECG01016138.1/~~gb/GECG01016138.1/.p1  ORF type:complete len:281 (+),score=13.82 gb/GECG01016138.1/:1-843(+)